MDKYDLVFDIVEHPEKYSPQQIEGLLSDPEAKEIYNLLCKTDGTVNATGEVDVDAEWERFSRRHVKAARGRFVWFGSRAASIAVIVCTSIVAVAAGLAVTVAVIDRKPEATTAGKTDSIEAPISNLHAINAAQIDTVPALNDPVIFENEPLEEIMKAIGTTYGIDVVFNNSEAAALHLYYKLNPSLPIDEIITQLNTFEQINITREGETITID